LVKTLKSNRKTDQSFALALLKISLVQANFPQSITHSHFSLYCCFGPQFMGRKRGQIYRFFLQTKDCQKHSKLQFPFILTQTVQLISAVKLKHILWIEKVPQTTAVLQPIISTATDNSGLNGPAKQHNSNQVTRSCCASTCDLL